MKPILLALLILAGCGGSDDPETPEQHIPALDCKSTPSKCL